MPEFDESAFDTEEPMLPVAGPASGGEALVDNEEEDGAMEIDDFDG
jgi:hypothetical protein